MAERGWGAVMVISGFAVRLRVAGLPQGEGGHVSWVPWQTVLESGSRPNGAIAKSTGTASRSVARTTFGESAT